MKRLILFAAGLAVQSFVLADWQVDKRIDSMTDAATKTAVVTNELGHQFSIYRLSKDGPVWANFSLSDDMFDQVDWVRAPIYRIDKNDPIDLSELKRMQDIGFGFDTYKWTPKWVNFLIWHGDEKEGIADDLIQLMEGNVIVFRYYLSTGGYKDTSFPLNGAAAAISEAIGINQEIDHTFQADSKMFRFTYVSAVKQCRRNMEMFRVCLSQLKECEQSSNRDIDKFEACFAESNVMPR